MKRKLSSLLEMENLSVASARINNQLDLFEEEAKGDEQMDQAIVELNDSCSTVTLSSVSSDQSSEGERQVLLAVERRDANRAEVRPSEPDGEAAVPRVSQPKKASNLRHEEQMVDPAFEQQRVGIIGFTEDAYRSNMTFGAIEHSDPVLFKLLVSQLEQEQHDLRSWLLDDGLGK